MHCNDQRGGVVFFFCWGKQYLAVHSSPQAVGSRWLQQLPRPSLVEGDDGSHVVFADRAVDECGDEDSSQPLHAVQVCERFIGKVPETERGYIIIIRVREGHRIFASCTTAADIANEGGVLYFYLKTEMCGHFSLATAKRNILLIHSLYRFLKNRWYFLYMLLFTWLEDAAGQTWVN